jgi:hypothetical protein
MKLGKAFDRLFTNLCGLGASGIPFCPKELIVTIERSI